MPTAPLEEFIPRSIRPNVKKLLDHCSDLIEEVVNYGSHVARWCIDKNTTGDENAVAFLMYRNILELIDSISVLVRNSCTEPCKILLRSLFESFLNFNYLIEKDFNLKGMDFLVCYRHDEINVLRRFDPKDPEYKKYQEKKAKDIIVKNIPQKPVPDVSERQESLRKIFEHQSYKESSAEYEKYKAGHKGRPPKKWYSMRGGPNDVYNLADYLGFPAQYEVLYRSWSGLVHGTDIVNEKLFIVEQGVASFAQLRYPSDAPFVTIMAISFGLSAIRLMSDHYLPDKIQENADWYKRELEESYMKLNKIKFVDAESPLPSTSI